MTKKLTALILALLMLTSIALASDAHYAITDRTRFLIFATDGGSFIRPIELDKGTTVELSEYIPEKTGFTFGGWYSDSSKKTQITTLKLTEHTVVFAKWIPKKAVVMLSAKAPEPAITRTVTADGKVVLKKGDKTVAVSVTEQWQERNERFEALMKVYNEKFK